MLTAETVSPIDRGENREQVIFGAVRAASFIRRVAAGEVINGRRYDFNGDLVLEIHDRVYMAPGVKGGLRETSSTTVGGEQAGSHLDLHHKLNLYGRWLGEQVGQMRGDPENIVLALEVAAAAHYGLTRPEFHPFDNGNGRTARALVNLILMTQSYELTALGIAVPPLPIIRSSLPESDRYLRALRAVGTTRTLNPLMSYLAYRWLDNINERRQKIQTEIKRPLITGDKHLIDKLEQRKRRLRRFLHDGTKGDYKPFLIPDYYALRHIKW